jgi:maltose alpha-D-glucosyltransferase / alpha-amylase
LLGERTGELHMALASDSKDPAFAAEPFTAAYRRSLYQGARSLADYSLNLLQQRLKVVPQQTRPDAEAVLRLEGAIMDRFRQILNHKMTAMRIRCHGDYHLGQVLFTGKDFTVIDFEGEPARPIIERRQKHSPLRDVAGMIRSFNYAALTKLSDRAVRPEDAAQLRPWARFWNLWISVEFLKGFFQATEHADFMPKSRDEISLLLDLFLLEKVVYELSYELNNRPDWVSVPIAGILEMFQPRKS